MGMIVQYVEKIHEMQSIIKIWCIAFAFWTHQFKLILFVYSINFIKKVYLGSIKFEFAICTSKHMV
jgi:hypothetical protein